MPVFFGLCSALTSSSRLSSLPLRRPAGLTRLGLAASLMLGIILSASIAHSEVAPSVVSDIHPPEDIAPLTRTALLDRLADAHVIYLGEYHDRAYDHQAQLEIIRELQARNPKLTIAMEMFQRPFQGAIDDYLAGEIDEADLIDRTEYETRWGYPWELYAPILRFAREAGIPVIAANAPMELTRKVAAAGLAGLSGDDFRDVPPLAEIRLDDVNYRYALYELFQMHMHVRSEKPEEPETSGISETSNEAGDSEPLVEAAEVEERESVNSSQVETQGDRGEALAVGHGDDGFDRFFAAQVLWDETMAEAIAQAYRDDPDRQIIVLAGRGHIAYNFGIPSRVQRRVIGESEDVDMIEVNPLELEIPELETPGLDPSRQIPADPAIFVQTSVFFAQQDADRESIWPIPDGLDRQLVDYFWSF